MLVDDAAPNEERTQEQRFVDLECRLAHHERAAEDLSSVVVTQGHMIDVLTRQVHLMIERQKDQDAGWAASPQDLKPPPHY